MLNAMQRRFLLLLPLIAIAFGFSSCAEAPEKKPVGPTSENSNLSWTGQVTNPIQGQFGMMPQNQYRR
jgi:hypothetical protein